MQETMNTPHHDRLISINEVQMMVGRRKSWIYKQVAARRFPQPVRARWSFSEVVQWIADQLRTREVAEPAASCEERAIRAGRPG